jgi:hypothetical protein
MSILEKNVFCMQEDKSTLATWFALQEARTFEEIITAACADVAGCVVEAFIEKVTPHCKKETSLRKQIMIAQQLAVEMTCVEQPNWQFVGARLLLAHRYAMAREQHPFSLPPYSGLY